jgi:hypothetical protein
LNVDLESDDGLVLGQDCGREGGGGHLEFDFNVRGRPGRRDARLQRRGRGKTLISQ